MRSPNARVWTVVLAGGEGERLRPLTEQWLGQHLPKQYCTFVGTRSMLEHTLDRAMQLSPSQRVVTVMARSHASLPLRGHRALSQGSVVLQPDNRDTAPGVFLALTYVYAADPDATVVIFPSDHFIHPEDLFVRQVHGAMLAAIVLDRVVLLGVAPHGLEIDYGWIQPGPALDDRRAGCRAHAIRMFVEKPPKAVAQAFQRTCALWNTMVVAASARRLWALGRRCLPDVRPGSKA
jgi:mannose-1-phosphate guanylyltransferase